MFNSLTFCHVACRILVSQTRDGNCPLWWKAGINHWTISSVQFIQLVPILFDPVDRSMPGLPVHHQLPEST